MAANIGFRFPGRRSFIAGSIILIAFGAVHGIGGIVEHFNPSTDPKEMEMVSRMKEFQIGEGAISISMWGAFSLLSNSYTVLLIFAGITGLLVVRPMAVVGRLRAITIMNIMLCFSLVGMSLVWMFAPPLAFACLALAAFCASLARQHLIKVPAA